MYRSVTPRGLIYGPYPDNESTAHAKALDVERRLPYDINQKNQRSGCRSAKRERSGHYDAKARKGNVAAGCIGGAGTGKMKQ